MSTIEFESIDPMTGELTDMIIDGVSVVPNDTGIIPTEFKVLIKPDLSATELQAQRIPNFVVPPGVADNLRFGTTTGRIVAVSPAAFTYHEWQPGDRVPAVGDRVAYARYAGVRINGRPEVDDRGREVEREYLMLNDKDIIGVLDF